MTQHRLMISMIAVSLAFLAPAAPAYAANEESIVLQCSGEVLFAPSQCKLSALKVACEINDGNSSRQVFISRTSGDAMFEGYSQATDERSTLVVERCACIKEAREPLF